MLLFSLALATCAAAQSVVVEGALARQYNIAPGGQASGTVPVRNLGAEATQVRAYLTDYSFRLGTTEYGEAGKSARSNAGWITHTPRIFSIGPGETVDVQYTVQVPQDDKLSGTYWSVLMVEPDLPPAPPPQGQEGKMVLAIRSVFRYGVQIATTIPGTGAAEVKFAAQSVVTQGDKRTLQVDVENTGSLLLNAFLWAEFHDARSGELVARAESPKRFLYPGCVLRQELDVSTLPAGEYQVLAVADNGDEHAFGAQFNLHIN